MKAPAVVLALVVAIHGSLAVPNFLEARRQHAAPLPKDLIEEAGREIVISGDVSTVSGTNFLRVRSLRR